MSQYELKTRETDASVQAFIDAVEHPQRREDAQTLLALFSDVTGLSARMWGSSIIGFGRYQYRYKSGHSGEFMRTGFSPRKQNLALYIISGFDAHKTQLQQLGKYKTGKSCLYINKLSDVDMAVLADVIRADLEQMAIRYPE